MINFLAAAATPLIKSLMENGLTTLADAVAAKGKEAVENIIGVKLEDKIKPEDAMLLKQLEFDHEEKLRQISLEERKLDVAAEQAAGEAVTKRWEADMLSDSWLSKNIRPLVLIYLLGSYTFMSLMSAADINVNPTYVELLGEMLKFAFGAYFVGRSVEKVIDMKERGRVQ